MANAAGAKSRVSTKGQIVLPKALRDRRKWAPGTELTVQSVVADYLSGRLHTRDSRHASINLPTAYRKLLEMTNFND